MTFGRLHLLKRPALEVTLDLRYRDTSGRRDLKLAESRKINCARLHVLAERLRSGPDGTCQQCIIGELGHGVMLQDKSE